MKRKQFLSLLLAVCLASGSIFFTGCGKSTGSNTTASKQAESGVLSFVAADKTNWDKEVAIGEYAYTFQLNLAEDNTFVLRATCIGAAPEEQAQGMGMGDFGNMGGEEAPAEEEAPVEEEAPAKDEDFSKRNFDIDGTWEYETGWGYTLSFNDGANTVVTADFDKASSRQYFYYDVEVDGTKTQVEFQAEDKNFRQEMASDYVIAEERNASYIFEGSGNTSTGNAAKATIYLEEDGTASIISLSGSSSTYTRGTWTEDTDAHQITLSVDGVDSVSDYCDVEGKEGYRLAYVSSAGMGPSTTISCYAPLVDGVKAREYTAADFEGEAILSGTCGEGDYTVELTEKGYVTILSAGSAVETGKYTYDEASDSYEITISTGTFTAEKSGAGYNLTAEMPLVGMAAMMGNAEPESRTFTLQ